MNAAHEARLRAWLSARDPGDAPGTLRAAVASVPHRIPRAAWPVFDAALSRFFGPASTVRAALMLAILVALALAVVGAALILRSDPFPPRGLIAFSSRDGNDIRLIAADGSGDRRLTDTPETIETHPRWSPDGTKLVFLRFSGPPEREGCRPPGDVVLFDLASSTERVLASAPTGIVTADWSPDGSRIAYTETTEACDSFQTKIVDVASGAITDGLTADWAPELAWLGLNIYPSDAIEGSIRSPDGRFDASSGPNRAVDQRVEVVDREAGRRFDLGFGGVPSWSPGSGAVAFVQQGAFNVGFQEWQHQLAVAIAPDWRPRDLGPIVTPGAPSVDGRLFAPTLLWTDDSSAIYWLDVRGAHIVDVQSGEVLDLPDALEGCDDLVWQPLPES